MSDTAMLRRTAPMRLETDEEGMLRAVAPAGTVGVTTRYLVGISTPKSTEAAWKNNPRCHQCHERVDAPSDAALVILPNKDHRIAHRGECFVLACVTANPLITTGAALRRQPDASLDSPETNNDCR